MTTLLKLALTSYLSDWSLLQRHDLLRMQQDRRRGILSNSAWPVLHHTDISSLCHLLLSRGKLNPFKDLTVLTNSIVSQMASGA